MKQNRIALAIATAAILYGGNIQAQIVDKNANTGTVSRPSTPSDEGKTKMLGEDPLDMNLKAVQAAFDTSDINANVVTYQYDPNVTYKIRTRVGMRTMIKLDENETIWTYLIGNPTVFNVVQIPKEEFIRGVIPYVITIKPIYAGADTNLTVITKSGKVFNFYLRADPVKSQTVPYFTVNVTARGLYDGTGPGLLPKQPETVSSTSQISSTEVKAENLPDARIKKNVPYTVQDESKAADYLKTTEAHDKFNFKYKAYGSEELSPAMVYDDGNFTYFDFRDRLSSDRLPVVFKVIDKYDTVVNTRMEKGFLIAESLSQEGWTLKNGDQHTCIKATGPVGARQRQPKSQEITKEYENIL